MANDLDFTGRRALITGAASGIGAACAHWLAERGIAELALVDRDAAGLAALALPCPVQAVVGDVADPALWDKLSENLTIDHAVINAGIADNGTIAERDFVRWRRVMAVNLDGAFLALGTALAAMRRAGRGGSVVLTASIGGIKPEPGTAAYGASKAAVIHLARVAAKESADAGIRVNAIAPGGVDTPIWDDLPFFRDLIEQHGGREKAITALAGMATPLGRYATANETAGQIGFLLSDMAATITGAVLVSDGGYSL